MAATAVMAAPAPPPVATVAVAAAAGGRGRISRPTCQCSCARTTLSSVAARTQLDATAVARAGSAPRSPTRPEPFARCAQRRCTRRLSRKQADPHGSLQNGTQTTDGAVSVTSANASTTRPVGSGSRAGPDPTPRARDRCAGHCACMHSNDRMTWHDPACCAGAAHMVSHRDGRDARHSTAYEHRGRRDGK